MEDGKVGDVFVMDAGGGFSSYRLVLSSNEFGNIGGLTILVTPDGSPCSINIDRALSLVPPAGWTLAKYGDPVPVGTQALEVPDTTPVAESTGAFADASELFF